MPRLIDADALKEELQAWATNLCDPNMLVKHDAEYIIDSAPSIDIVRCGECIFSDGEKPIADGRSWCVVHGGFMYYCSDGKRKEG